MTLLGDLLLCAGSVLLFWGTCALFSKKPVVVKLHALGVGDTLGAFLFVLGLLLRSTEGRGLLAAAAGALLLWGPILSYALGRGAVGDEGREGE